MATAAASPYSGLGASTSGTSGAGAYPAGSASTSNATMASKAGSKDYLVLTPQIMSSFKPAKVFRENVQEGKMYTSLSFDDKGEQVITAAEDEAIQLYNVRTGKHTKQLYSKKYGVNLARFTHKSSTIIYASTKEDDTIRYLSLHDNSYLRYFKGHKRKVTSLEMSPMDDTFLSASEDDTVRMWDLRSNTAQGLLNVAAIPSVTYDPSGMIFAVTLNLLNTTLLYDIRKLDAEPFGEIVINDPSLAKISWPPRVPVSTSVKFSNDGNHILIGTSGNVHYVVHSYDYKVLARLEGHHGLEHFGKDDSEGAYHPSAGISGEETSWTPDGRYVLSGSNDGKIYVWDVNPPAGTYTAEERPPPGPECTLLPVKVIEGHKNSPSRVVRFNPKHAMFVSGGIGELAFWLNDSKAPGEGGSNISGDV